MTQLYQNFFDREPDAQGLAYWVGRLTSDTLDFAEVMEGFAMSAEYQALIAGEISQGIQYDFWLG